MPDVPTKVAIVHYHLDRGGVTRIIEIAFPQLQKNNIEPIILTGKPYEGAINLPTAIVPNLAYTGPNTHINPQNLANEIEQAAESHFGSSPDLFHFHNHALGKNHALPDTIHLLALKGYPILLHLHDFAEDYRPTNYQYIHKHISNSKVLYPISPRIHYATINQRDLSFLNTAGAPKENLHHIPNPVAQPLISQESPPDSLKNNDLFLYVTRGIRRKNLGELLLLSALNNNPDALFATTLSPTNPSAQDIHKNWSNLAKQLNLPVQFGINDDPQTLSFNQALSATNTFITTSIAEGFGMAFMEPFLMHKPLIGRNLPDITSDFSKHGITLDNLYSRLEIPQDFLDIAALKDQVQTSLNNFYKAYGQNIPSDALEAALGSIIQEEKIDFGRLDEPLQEAIIKAAASSPDIKKVISTFNPLPSTDSNTIDQYNESIKKHYCPERYCQKLFNTYQSIIACPQGSLDWIDPQRLLHQFLDPKRFSLIRN